MSAVGWSVSRKNGIGKATGRTLYADDIVMPGMLHGRTIRSTIPRGRVKSASLDFDMSGFTIIDHRDIPAGGRNVVTLIDEDQPFLVEHEVNHCHGDDRLFGAHTPVRIIQTETGGGFGGKEEYPSMIFGHAGNVPGACELRCADPGSITASFDASCASWTERLSRQPLQPHTRHRFTGGVNRRPYTHVRLNILPDGGVARLRLVVRVARA